MNTIDGVIPVVPTIFTDDENLDLRGQRRVVDYLVDAKSDGLCVLANYSEQFSISDEERVILLETIMTQVAGRIPVCVATSHFSSRIAAQRSLTAQARGAAMVMLMPPFVGANLKVDESALFEYFKRVTDCLEIDVMVQDSPLSSTPLSVSILAKLAREIPHIKYVKIEVPQSADKIRNLRSTAGGNLPGLYDGEEAITLIHDLDAGARGTMCSSAVPDWLGNVIRQYHLGNRDIAVAEWENLLPLIHFENRQCGLRAAKVLMKEGGIIDSEKTRTPISELHPDTRAQLIEVAKRKDPLVLRWSGTR